jgi:hypothetical protein
MFVEYCGKTVEGLKHTRWTAHRLSKGADSPAAPDTGGGIPAAPVISVLRYPGAHPPRRALQLCLAVHPGMIFLAVTAATGTVVAASRVIALLFSTR